MKIEPIISSLKFPDCMLYAIACLIFTWIATPTGQAEPLTPLSSDRDSLIRDSLEIYFQQSHSEIDPAYRHNEARIDSLWHNISSLSSLSSKGNPRLLKLEVIGSASPEGSYRFNKTLSENRAKHIFDYIGKKIVLSDSLTRFHFLGRNWNGLRQLVAADSDMPLRGQVLDAIDRTLAEENPPSEYRSNLLLSHLKGLGKGKAYRYMYHNLFPRLRFSSLVVEYAASLVEETPLPTDSCAQSIEICPLEPEPEIVTISEEDIIRIPVSSAPKPFYMDLHTNLLLDGTLIPNIGVEFYLGKNFSIYGDWMHAWWSKDSSHRYWRMYGGEIGGRWWFGKAAHSKPLTGHHIGLYAGAFTFDFELGGTGYMGGKPHGTIFDRCFVHAGAEYGYSLPVAKRLNIDFTIGVGYMTGKYITYEPGKRPHIYYWESTKKFKWFGPTKAEISLVWLIGRGNRNH